MSTSSGFVYFLSSRDASDLVKIGKAGSVDRRRRGLQTGNPNTLFFCAESIRSDSPLALEASIHSFLKKRRVRGEWFRITNDQIKEVRRFFHEKENGCDELCVPLIVEGCYLTDRRFVPDEPFARSEEDFHAWASQQADLFPADLRNIRYKQLIIEKERRLFGFELERYRFCAR